MDKNEIIKRFPDMSEMERRILFYIQHLYGYNPLQYYYWRGYLEGLYPSNTRAMWTHLVLDLHSRKMNDTLDSLSLSISESGI